MESSQALVSWLAVVPDPRLPNMTRYPLSEILFSTLIGMLCRMEEWDDIVCFSEENLDWLRQFFPYEEGVASASTFRTVFSRIDQSAFAAAFSAWAEQWGDGGVVAIDGKTLRGTGKKGALHLLNAYAHEHGMVLGQQPVDGKSNEITAIPEFLESLVLRGAIVTVDAMGAQKNIAATILAQEADYVLALKGNQSSLHDDVREFFADPALTETCSVHRTVDAGHGRIEERCCRAVDATTWLCERHPSWEGLRSIVAVTSRRTSKKTGESSSETRFYISSLAPEAERLLQLTRAHWSIENNLHWTLDVTFREDLCRTRKNHAAANLSLIRKTALNLLKLNKEKIPIKRKQLKAALSNNYRTKLIKTS